MVVICDIVTVTSDVMFCARQVRTRRSFVARRSSFLPQPSFPSRRCTINSLTYEGPRRHISTDSNDHRDEFNMLGEGAFLVLHRSWIVSLMTIINSLSSSFDVRTTGGSLLEY